MAAFLVLLLLAVGISQTISGSLLTPIVETDKGPVQGEILETIQNKIKFSSFRGIPYAESPVGYRRFRPPVDKEPWTEVLKATEDGNSCFQRDLFFKTYTGSEDCLYLNVYTPNTMLTSDSLRDLKPVMVWIYGGRFLNGYANSSLYGPDFIIEHDVVLVSFNYRLGPLGFLNLEHENATGNAGLKDQNAALKWVQKNIINFGGNPNSVTIFGQSAGAVSVDYHVLSDMSKGLFHKSISMSGSPLVPWGFQKPQTAVEHAFELGKRLGVDTKNKDTLLETLYKASALDISKIGKKMTKLSAAFRPTVERTDIALNEEKFLTECPDKKYRKGRFNKGPQLMGYMHDEAVAFGNKIQDIIAELEKEKSGKSFWARAFLNPAIEGLEKLSESFSVEALEVVTKILFVSGIDEKQKLMSIHNGHPIYYYKISVKPTYSLHRNIRHIKLNGAAHADDLLYLFHTTLADIPMDPESLLTITRNRVLLMWTNFAKTGNPNPISDHLTGIAWPDSRSDGRFLKIDNQLSVVNHRPYEKTAKVLQSLDIGIASC